MNHPLSSADASRSRGRTATGRRSAGARRRGGGVPELLPARLGAPPARPLAHGVPPAGPTRVLTWSRRRRQRRAVLLVGAAVPPPSATGAAPRQREGEPVPMTMWRGSAAGVSLRVTRATLAPVFLPTVLVKNCVLGYPIDTQLVVTRRQLFSAITPVLSTPTVQVPPTQKTESALHQTSSFWP